MTEQIFEFKTVGVGDILAAYRQIEASQKAFEEASKRSVGSLGKEALTIRELAKASQELAQSNLSILNVAKSSQAEIGKQIAAEIRLANQIKATNAAYRDRNVAASSGQSQFSDTISKSLEESITGSIEQGFRNAKKGNIAGLIGNVLSAPFKAAGSAVSGAVSSIGLGLVQSITAPIGANFGKGLSNALEQSLSKSVGSSELFAEKVGGAISAKLATTASKGITSGLSGLSDAIEKQIEQIEDKKLRDKLQNIVNKVRETPAQARQAVTDTLGGQDAIDREGLSRRGSRQLQQDAETNIVREQSIIEWRQSIAELDKTRASAVQRLTFIEGEIRKRQEQLIEAQQNVAKLQTTLARAQAAGADDETLQEIAQELTLSGRELSAIAGAIEALEKGKTLIRGAVKEAEQKAQKASATTKKVAPISQPKEFVELAKIALGDQFSLDKLPELTIADESLKKAGAISQYDPLRNRIEVTREFYEDLKKAVLLSEKQANVLAEELQHAVDLDFGSAKGIQASREGRVVGAPLIPTAEEFAQFAPNLGLYDPKRREIELSGKTGAVRSTQQYLADRGKIQQQTSASAFAATEDIAARRGQELESKLVGFESLAQKYGDDVSKVTTTYREVLDRIQSDLSELAKQALEDAKAGTLDEGKIQQFSSRQQSLFNQLLTVEDKLAERIAKYTPPDTRTPLQIPLKLENQPERELVEVEPKQKSQPLALRKEQDQPTFKERATSAAEGVKQIARSAVEGVEKVASVIKQVGEKLEAPATVVAKGLVSAGKGVVAVAKTSYKVAEALESFTLDIVPAGRGIKAVGKNIALPALAFAGASTLIPGAAPAIGAATQLTSSALAPFASAASAGAGSTIGGLLPNVLGLQGAVTGAATGALDLAFAGASVLLAKTGVAVVGGRTVATLAGRTARVFTDVINSAIDGAAEQVDKAKVKRAESKARAKEKGAIDVAVAPVVEEASQSKPSKPAAPKTPPSAAKPTATQAQIDAAIAEAQNLDKQFASAYQSLKDAIKADDARLVTAYQKTIRELATRAKSDVDELIAGLQASGDKSGAIGKLAGVKGRLSQKESRVEKQVAKFQKDLQVRGEDLNAQSLDVTLGFGGVDKGLESLKRAAAKTADALNGAIAAFAEIEKQATLAETAKQAARTPKVQAVARDLAVNSAGFVASKVASSQGDVAGLAGDAIGALAARQAINAATPFVQAYLELKKTLEFREATNKEKVQQIIALVTQYRVTEQQQSEELFGDLVGFGVGNTAATLANSGLDALSDTVPAAKILRAIPFKGAAAAVTAVPQLAKLRERINERIQPQEPDRVRGEDLNAQSLNPNAILQNLSSRRKQLLEIVEQKIGNAIDELSLKLKNQPDLIDNAQVTRTLKRLNQATERILGERGRVIDEVSEKQFQEFLATQQAVLTRIQAKQKRQPDISSTIDDIIQKEARETIEANQKELLKAQRQAFENQRKDLAEVTGELGILRVNDGPVAGENLVRDVKLFFSRFNADIQERVRLRLQKLLAESTSLGNDIATSQTVLQGRGETGQAKQLGAQSKRLNAAQQEAQRILIKPRVEVTDKDVARLKELEQEIRNVYKAVNVPPPPNGGFLGQIDENAGSTLKKFGGVGAAVVGLGAGQFASQALQSTARGAVDEFKTFADFDQQLRTFGVVSQSSEKQVAGVRTEIERLSQATVKTPQEISAAAVEFTKLGFNSEKTSAALAGIVQSSSASGESLATTAQVIGTTLNQFQLPAEESIKVADLLTQASNASATGTAQIGESLKYVGSQAKESGQTIEETVTVLALMSASGLEASSAGTGLAEALKRIKTASALATTELDELKSRGSGPAVAAFKLLNEQVRGADGKLLPFTQVLNKVKKGLEGFKQTDKDLILNALFGVQGSRAVLSVIGLSEQKIAETTSAMKDFQGQSKKAADALTQGASGSIQQFTGSLELLKIRAGETAGAGFTPLLNAGTALINGFLSLNPNLQKFLIVVAGLGTTLAAATVAIIAFNIANESIVGTIARSTIALIADAGATAAKTVATNALTASQALANTQITRAGIVTGVSTIATNAAAIATSTWATVTSGKLIPSLVAWATQAKVAGVASLSALAPLAAAAGAVAAVALVADTYASIRGGAEEARKGQESLTEALRQFRLEAEKKPKTIPDTPQTQEKKGVEEASKELNPFQKGLDAVRGILAPLGAVTAAQERYNNKIVEFSDLLTQSDSVINTVQQSQAELAALQSKIAKGTEATAALKLKVDSRTATKEEEEQYKNSLKLQEDYNKKLEDTRKLIDATTEAVKGAKAPNDQSGESQKERLSTLEKLKASLTGNVKTTQELAAAEQKEVAAKQKVLEEIKAKLELGELSQSQALSELEDVKNNSATEAKVRKEAADAIVKIRQDQINAEIAEIQAGQAEVEAALATGRISEEEADKQTTQLKIDEINKRIEANQVALDAANDPAERQKLLAEERKLQADITKTRAEEQKRRYERELKEVEKEYKKANDAIRQAETERLTELQVLANKGAIRQEELEKEKANATVQRTEEEYDAEVEKLNKLRALPRLDDQAGREAQANQIADQEQKIADVTLKRLQVQEEAENRVRAIVIRNLKEQLAAQQRNTNATVAGLEKQTAQLDFVTKSLERQNRLLQSRNSLSKAVSDASISGTNIELTNVQRALEIRQQLDSGQVKSKQEQLVLEGELNRLGFSTGQSALSILEQKQALENRLAEQKRAALLSEQAQARASLELELKLNDLAAKRAVFEAKIADVKARGAVIDAQGALKEAQIQAQKSGDKSAVANAEQALQLAKQNAGFASQGVVDAQESAKAQSEIAANSQKMLEIQQQTALREFDAAEAARQNGQYLEYAKLQADGLADNLERAANASDRINQNTGGGSLPGRKDGGSVESGQAYIVGEHSPEVFVPGASGVVLNRDQINQNLDTLFRASPGFNFEPQFNPRVAQPQASSGALNTLVAETRSLRASVERLEQRKPVQTVTANFPDGADSREWDRFLKLQRSVLRSQI